MKNLLLALLLCTLVISCNYQETPPPPEAMEKVVIVDVIDSSCSGIKAKVMKLKDSTMAAITVKKIFIKGDVILVQTKDLSVQ